MPIPLKQSALFLPVEFAGNHLGNQRSIATHAVINNEINPVFVPHSLTYYWQNILDHFRVQHPIHHFIEREGFNIGFFIAHPKRGHETNDHLLARVEERLIDLGKLFPQWGQPSPMGIH